MMTPFDYRDILAKRQEEVERAIDASLRSAADLGLSFATIRLKSLHATDERLVQLAITRYQNAGFKVTYGGDGEHVQIGPK